LIELIQTIHRILPHAALRTTMMVGFPGETEDDITEMTDFLQEHHFDHLGVFAYANEEGCRAASLPNQIDAETKEERLQKIMELQADISFAALQKYVGAEEQVLICCWRAEPDTRLLKLMDVFILLGGLLSPVLL
jgi:ribosomal protein S12 methylthiotransferase